MTCWKCLVLEVTVLILNFFSCLPLLPFLLWLRTTNRFDLQVGSVGFSEEFWPCLVWKLQSWSYKRCWTKLRHSTIKEMWVYKGPSENLIHRKAMSREEGSVIHFHLPLFYFAQRHRDLENGPKFCLESCGVPSACVTECVHTIRMYMHKVA